MEGEKSLYRAVLEGNAKLARSITEEELARGADPQGLVNQMILAMDEVGRLFECHDYFVPELLISARAMKASLELLRPHLTGAQLESKGKVVIGTVKGDLHDIGKNLVAAMLEGAGYEILDLGTDVPPGEFVKAVVDHKAGIVALSALLTTTMPGMKGVIEALDAAGLRQQVKVLVGGAPVTADYARQIGADGYGESATAAVNLVRGLPAAGS